ncbi:MAG: serine/threonine protein kinase, partial [Akkermansiaceae bacterium]|nr:serine/threonine protein kinase [Akkermansiaceae bacterium]
MKCPGCGDEVRVKTVFDNYTLLRRLATGGMSVVFVARDETLGREVALKVLAEEYSADAKRGLDFEQEAELTAAVSHPNVVRVFTVGRAFERFYIAMELVDGPSLEQQTAERGALPEHEILPLALQVVDGLRAAQEAGLIHRDIKPGNILIDSNGTAKIVDFGLSRLTEGGAVRAEEVWATPYYVSPEGVDGREEDFRSDIYALGATLYHALAGKPPVDIPDMSTRALRAAKRKVRPVGKMAPWLTEETQAAVDRAMACDPEQRFGSYAEFRTALEAALASLGGEEGEVPVHGAARVRRRERRKHTAKAWTAGGMTVLALLALTAMILTTVLGPVGEEAVPGPGAAPVLAVTDEGAGFDPVAAEEINAAYQGAR